MGAAATVRPATTNATVVVDPAIIAVVSDHYPVAITLMWSVSSSGGPTTISTAAPTPTGGGVNGSSTAGDESTSTNVLVIGIAAGAAVLLVVGVGVGVLWKTGRLSTKGIRQTVKTATNQMYVA